MEGLITGDAQTREVGEATGPGRLVLPVAIEEMEVGRRTVTTGLVRVRKHVREHEEVLDETVSREDVHVERMPIGTIVDTPPTIRNEGSTLIIPVLEEVLVVEKRLRLKEEVHITWQRVVEPAPQRVTLRDEELTVERIDPNEATPAEGHPLERPTG
ncbi:MAG: YsnF/AvaK domain-containing protein [Chloroflexales bacterium]|nr:YsnF/AvaK domain-containing protein [Chloroflexales bacterium]